LLEKGGRGPLSQVGLRERGKGARTIAEAFLAPFGGVFTERAWADRGVRKGGKPGSILTRGKTASPATDARVD